MQIDAGNKESVCFGRWWLLSALVALIVVGCDVDLVVPLGETKMHANHPFPSPEEISKLPPDGGDRYNRLIFEKSPYLIQHATNPVDWYAWGAAAFEKAKREDKPIFLSIGYSTCHWCHVMETESFEDPEVAKLLNDHFVSIKVDREERPDIDSLYMAVTMALTGRGGWPMTCVLTPDKQPFFAGTYFPRESRFGMPGMLELLPKLAQAWEEQRDAVLKSAESIVESLRQDGQRSSSAQLDDAVLVQAYEGLAGLYDEMHCGFGSAPKFPSPGNLYFLLRHAYRSGDSKALAMVEGTLQAMRRGGIYDHVGFGFHRYATDRAWLVPHFEKMLYDQALLVLVYTEAFQVTGKQEYADTVREIATYVLRDMTSPEGGFYSAEDADSEGEEGKFYLWTRDAMAHVLGEEETQRFASLFGVGEAIPGWEEEGSILHETQSWADAASEAGVSESDLHHAWEQARVKLFNARELRIHPFKDDKILTDWNGLMIMALGKAGSVLHEPQFVQAAEKAADLVLARLRDDQGRLHHRMRQGEVGLPAHLEDYAYLAWGLIDLYEATFETEYLKAAVELTETQIALYWDGDAGGFFQSQESDDLLVRRKDAYDGAIPSGNAVAALNLLRLARMTGKPEWEEKAQALMTAFGEQVNRAPSGYTFLLSALAFAQGPSYEVVVAGRQGAQDTQAVLEKFSSVFAPNMVLLYRPTGEDVPAIAGLAEFTRYQEAIEGKATIYVCRNFTCERPTTDVQAALAIIQGRVP